MNGKIEETQQQVFRYYYVDGLVELAIGGLFLVAGVLTQLFTAQWATRTMIIVGAIGLPILTIFGGLLVKRAVTNLKERVTHPRTGYVAYRKGTPPNGRWFVVGAALALVLVLTILPEEYSQMPFVMGALLLIILIYMGYRVDVKRFYLLGVVAGLIGVGAMLAVQNSVKDVSNELQGASLTLAGTGLVLLISGGLVFLSYLRRNPVQEV